MPLIHSAVVPHAPVLFPTVGKEQLDAFRATVAAFDALREHIYVLRPDTVVMFSPHGELESAREGFVIQSPSVFSASFEEFGDISSELEYRPDHILADRIKYHFEDSDFPVVYDGREELDYGASVPLSYLLKGLNAKLVMIHPPARAPMNELYEFGKGLYNVLQSTSTRIVSIASCDMAHTLSEDAPGGFDAKGEAFDKDLIKVLKSKRPGSILNIAPDHITAAKSCCLPPVSILAGVLSGHAYKPSLLSYEGPLGVGHMIMEFSL